VKLAVESFQKAVAVICSDGNIKAHNDAFHKIMHLKNGKAAKGKKHLNTEFIQLIQKAKRSETVNWGNKQYEVSKFPYESDEFVVCEEVTENKTESVAQRDYFSLSRIFEATVSGVYDSIIITDMDDTIIYINQSFTRHYGYTADELEGMRGVDFWSEHNLQFNEIDIKDATFNKGGFHGELLNKRKDGTVFPVLLSTTLVYDDDGNPHAAIGLARDISEEKRILEQLEVQRMKSEEASRLKTNLMANMSHEVRTPLTGIIGFASFLVDQLQETPDLLFYVENIKSSGERLLETMNNILMVSEIESNRTKVRFRETTLYNVLHKSISYNRPLALKTGLKIELTGEESLTAWTDELLLYQILNILVNNALKFTEKGGVNLHVSEHENHVSIQVKDTGVGISEEFLNKMYKAFEQESAGIRRRFQGVGLGLYICKKYADLIGCRIDVESEKHKGSTFTVMIPKKDPESV